MAPCWRSWDRAKVFSKNVLLVTPSKIWRNSGGTSGPGGASAALAVLGPGERAVLAVLGPGLEFLEKRSARELEWLERSFWGRCAVLAVPGPGEGAVLAVLGQ